MVDDCVHIVINRVKCKICVKTMNEFQNGIVIVVQISHVKVITIN